jgi:hypothetical protein
MRTLTKALLGILAGIAAGVASWIGIEPVLEPGLVSFTAVLNTVTWSVAVGFYAFVYGQFDRLAERDGWKRENKSVALGGIAGLVASTGVAGAMGLGSGVVSVRLGAVFGLFVFGVVLASMAVGMLTVIWRFDVRSGPADHGAAADPAD